MSLAALRTPPPVLWSLPGMASASVAQAPGSGGGGSSRNSSRSPGIHLFPTMERRPHSCAFRRFCRARDALPGPSGGLPPLLYERAHLPSGCSPLPGVSVDAHLSHASFLRVCKPVETDLQASPPLSQTSSLCQSMHRGHAPPREQGLGTVWP